MMTCDFDSSDRVKHRPYTDYLVGTVVGCLGGVRPTAIDAGYYVGYSRCSRLVSHCC